MNEVYITTHKGKTYTYSHSHELLLCIEDNNTLLAVRNRRREGEKQYLVARFALSAVLCHGFFKPKVSPKPRKRK